MATHTVTVNGAEYVPRTSRADWQRAQRAEAALEEIHTICTTEPDAVTAATRAAQIAEEALKP